MNPFERELERMILGIWGAVKGLLLQGSRLGREAAPTIALLLLIAWLLEDHFEPAKGVKRTLLYLLVVAVAAALIPRVLGWPR